nr:uncharacterized protein LOC113818215 [Penaeus vannamei]
MRNLVLLVALLACAAALPEPQGLFRQQQHTRDKPMHRPYLQDLDADRSKPASDLKPITKSRVVRGRFPVGGRQRDNSFSDDKPTPARGSPQTPAPTTTPKPRKEITYACNENACAPGYSKFENKCYKVIQTDTPIDFTSAQRKCQADNAVLAADKSSKIHNFLKGLLKPHLSQTIDSQNNRAFLGLLCQDACDSPGNWVYADGSKCEGNDFCDWLKAGTTNEWNSLPTSLYGPSIAAMLDDYPDTNFRHKLQPYPADHTLQYMICQKDADSTEHLKPRNLKVQERLANVVIEWERPSCSGEFSNYILVLLGGSASYDTEMKCSENKCSYTLNPEVCNYCIHPNTDYTFSVAAVLSESQLGPAITINKKIVFPMKPKVKPQGPRL